MNDQQTDDPATNNPPQTNQPAQTSEFTERTVQPESSNVEAEAPVRSDAQLGIASEIEQPTGMAMAGGAATPMVQAQPAPQKSKKPLIIAVVAAVVALGLIGGSVYAYTVYQKPQNVLLHAASNALSTKQVHTKTVVTSDFVYEADGDKLSFEKLTFETGAERTPRYDTKAEIVATYNGKQVNLKGDVLVTDAGELYFRVSNAKDTLQKVLPAETKMTAKAEEYLAAIDGKWAKYTMDDLKKDNPTYGKTAQCTLDVYKKYKDDKKSIQEVVDLYKKHQFVVVKGEPTSKNGNFGYVVSIDKKQSKAYEKAIADTAMAKELDACDGKTSAPTASDDEAQDTTVDTPTKSDGPVTTTTLWISKWGHELRAIETKTTDIKGQNNKTYSVTSWTDVDFRTGVETATPKDAMAMKAWSETAQKFARELTNGAVEKRAADSAVLALANTVAKKAEAYNAINSAYPATVADFAKTPESKLSDPTLVVASLPADQQHVAYKKCSGSGAQIVYKKAMEPTVRSTWVCRVWVQPLLNSVARPYE